MYIKGAIEHKAVYKFPEDTVNKHHASTPRWLTDVISQKVSGVHIADLTALYGRIVEKIIRNETLPSGKQGYYFALAHDLQWWEILDHLALALKARGLVADTNLRVWPNDEVAAKLLGVPTPFVQALWNSGYVVVHMNRLLEDLS